MGGKLSPIIIIILLIVVIVVGIFMFKFVTSSGSGNNDDGSNEEALDKPVITLSKEVDEEDSNKVTITAYATTEDEEGIKEIVLPDGSSIVGGTASFLVEENGTYEFKAVCNNGQTATSKIQVTEIEEISANNPYMPEGFFEVGGDVESGYVIEDSYGNQYVWIPVENGKLTRNTSLNADYEETNGTASALVNSVAKYYGFYIARFEASQYEVDGTVTAASMSGKIPWTNITYLDAAQYAESSSEVFGYTDCSTALINSYAWDTALSWIDNSITNYSSNTNYGNYSGTIYPTGYTEKDNIKNICDLAGNVREWTTEIYKGTTSDSSSKKSSKDTTENIIQRVVRGGSANLSRTPGSHIYYPENTSDNYWGFRTILYK